MNEIYYTNDGWVGVPYESDFVAKWGTIKVFEIFDGRRYKTNLEAANDARSNGFGYMLAPKPYKTGNILFRVTNKNNMSVDKILIHLQHKANRNKYDYSANLSFRVKYILKNAKRRSSIKSDLTEEFVTEKILNGACEETGIPFNMDVQRGWWKYPEY